MVRAILEKGRIRPVTPLPGNWGDGQELVVSEAPSREESRDLDRWSREIDALAEEIPAEEFDRLDAALAEADREAKELVRRQMGLP